MIEIIPAIDIIDGKCVRLTQGDYNQKKIYSNDPLDVAKQYNDIGIRRLHMVDLDGAREGKVKNIHVLEKVAAATSLVIDYGGGIKSDADMDAVLSAGASYASIGSVAVKNKSLFIDWIEKYGPKKILLGADVKDGKIAVSGWMENTNIDCFKFIESNIALGINKIFCTDISKDGLLQGPSLSLYIDIIARFPDLYLIASGGVATIDDIYELEKAGCKSVIVGKAIYENRIKLSDLFIMINR